MWLAPSYLKSVSYYGAAVGFAAFSAGVGLLTRLNWPPVWDEGSYHLPLLPKFAPWPSLEILHSYNTAVGPFFYLFYGNLGRAFDYSLPPLRAISVVLGVITLLVIGRAAKDLHISASTATLLLVTPYFITLSTLLMSDILALCLFVIGLVLILSAVERDALEILQWSGAVAAMTAAEYTRQAYVVLPAALVLFAVLERRRRRSWVKLLAAGLASLALLAPLVIFWGGLVPDDLFVRSTIRTGIGLVTVANLNLLLIWVPLYLGPILISLGHWKLVLNRWFAILPLLALPLLVLAPPVAFGTDRLAGFYSSVVIFVHAPSAIRILLLVLLWSAGIVILGATVSGVASLRAGGIGFLLLVLALIGVTLMLSAGRLTERYFLPAIPVAILMFSHFEQGSGGRRLSPTLLILSGQALVSGLYFYNKLTGHFG